MLISLWREPGIWKQETEKSRINSCTGHTPRWLICIALNLPANIHYEPEKRIWWSASASIIVMLSCALISIFAPQDNTPPFPSFPSHRADNIFIIYYTACRIPGTNIGAFKIRVIKYLSAQGKHRRLPFITATRSRAKQQQDGLAPPVACKKTLI